MGSDAMIFGFLMLSSKSAFSLSYFTLIKRLFSFSLLSAVRVVSSAYLSFSIFLQTLFLLLGVDSILIPSQDMKAIIL